MNNDKLRMSETLLNAGMSKNGGWSDKQIAVFGVDRFQNPGWRSQIIGREFTLDTIERFPEMKDSHLKNKKASKGRKKQEYSLVQCYVAKGKPSAEIRAECPFDLPPDSAYDKALRKKREKDYRSADWKSEQDRMRHFDYLTEGI